MQQHVPLAFWVPALRSGVSRCSASGTRDLLPSGRIIAQLTFTVTDSVSSPGATAAGAAIGAVAILALNSGTGAPPSDTLSGEPSVTPVALA